MCRVRPTQTPMIKEKQREIPLLSTIPPAIWQEQLMFDLNSLLTEKEKIYMQDSELGSQVPLISSDGPRHGILPLEYGMRGQRMSASTWNSGSAYYSLWFYWSRFLLYFPFLSSYLNPKFWKYRESVLFNPFFSLSLCKIEKKNEFDSQYLIFSSSTLWT